MPWDGAEKALPESGQSAPGAPAPVGFKFTESATKRPTKVITCMPTLLPRTCSPPLPARLETENQKLPDETRNLLTSPVLPRR